jgi:hypothetical protein
MNLNSLELSKSDLQLLYKNSLVAIPEINSNLNPEKAAFKFLGENNKNILIVVRYPEAVHIPDKSLSFLTKLLAACHLHLGDVGILNFHSYSSTSCNDMLAFFSPATVLLFGVTPAEFGLPVSFPEFQVQKVKDTTYIFSPAIETIEPDKSLKGKLWNALKKNFNL